MENLIMHHYLTYGLSQVDRRTVEEDTHRMEGKVGRGQTDGYLEKH